MEGEDRAFGVAVAETQPADTAMPTIPPDGIALLPGTRVGRFVVLKTLGAGGMGIVYAAYDEELDRRVALKLLTDGSTAGRGSDGEQRLLREAQAMAKLSHPNVVSVFDVGAFGEQVFLAMEFVDGVTLRAWRRAQPRTTREVLGIYLQAGRALEAAHAEGILHRDFKPDNALIDTRGRVRVLDFGLARIDAPPMSAPGADLESTTSLAAPKMQLTHAGSIMGTPAYMSPEQLRGERLTPSSDQFTFCVALYEALYAQRPFAAVDIVALLSTLAEGEAQVLPAPPGNKVPRAVHAALVRGLSVKASDRFASMTELLAAIEAATATRRPLWLGAALVVLAASAAGLAFASRSSSAPKLCAGASNEIASTWGDAKRAEVARAFTATGDTRADATFTRLRSILDAYAASWAAMRTESCEATRLRGTQSDESLDLRSACLDERRSELAATVDLFAHANAKLVDNSIKVARSITPLDGCADVPSLRAPFAQPHDPAQRRLTTTVRDAIGRATAMIHARKYDDAIPLLTKAAEDAKPMGNRAVEAEALLALGTAQKTKGKLDLARETETNAALAAIASRDEITEAQAWTELVSVFGQYLGKLDEAQRYAAIARAAIERAGNHDDLRANLADYLGESFYVADKSDDALRVFRESLAFRIRAYGERSGQVARAESQIARVEGEQGHLTVGIAAYESAVAKQVAEYGEGSPLVSVSLYELAFSQDRFGDLEGAIASARRGLAGVSDGDPLHAYLRLTLGRALLQSGEKALGTSEATAAMDEEIRLNGEESLNTATALGALAETLVHCHEDDEARVASEKTIAIASKQDEGKSVRNNGHEVHALALARLGRSREARPEAEAALAEEVAAHGGPADVLLPLLASGTAAFASGDAQAAIALLERACAASDATEGYAPLHADSRFTLARALAMTHGDAARARDLATRAAADYDTAHLPALAAEARAFAAK